MKFPPLSDLIFSGESPQCVYEGICIHTLDNFKVDCSNHEAGKHEPVSFHQASIALHQEWSKTVDSNEAKGTLVRSYPVYMYTCWPEREEAGIPSYMPILVVYVIFLQI